MAAGSYDIACARFRDSDKLDPAVGTRFNLADCEEKRGRLATAWSLFRGVLSELAQDDDRKPIAEERVANLKPRLPIVTMVPPPDAAPGLRVRIDGVEIGEASFGVPLPMDPGPHDLSLLPADGTERRTTFVLSEGEHSELPLLIDASQASSAPDAATSEAPADSSAWWQKRRHWGLLAGGAGVAGVAVGAVAGIVTLSKKSTADDNCSESRRTCNQVGVDANESGRTYGLVSGVGFGIGVVGLAAGAYLLLTGSSSETGAEAAAHSSIPVREPGRAPALRDSSLSARLSADLRPSASSGFLSVAGRF
jgi:hypothetical protein